MIELNGRLINPAHVAIIENMPGKEGHVRLYVGGVALITPGTIDEVEAHIFGPKNVYYSSHIGAGANSGLPPDSTEVAAAKKVRKSKAPHHG